MKLPDEWEKTKNEYVADNTCLLCGKFLPGWICKKSATGFHVFPPRNLTSDDVDTSKLDSAGLPKEK